MKKILQRSLVVAASLFATTSFAQLGPSLGIGFELGVPTGTLNETQKIGVGGSAKFAFGVGGGTALTLSAGYISFSGDETRINNNIIVKNPALNFIPIKAGVRYKFGPSPFYLEPQLGYTSINTPNSNTSSTGGFTYAANAGFMFKKLDLSGRYEGISRNNNNIDFVGFRLAYNFSL